MTIRNDPLTHIRSFQQISQAAPMSNVHPSKWSALEHICHPRPTLGSGSLTGFRAEKQQNSRAKSDPHTFYPSFCCCWYMSLQMRWPPLCGRQSRFSLIGIYRDAVRGGTQCEECQIFGTEVWNCHLIVYLYLSLPERVCQQNIHCAIVKYWFL